MKNKDSVTKSLRDKPEEVKWENFNEKLFSDNKYQFTVEYH